MLLKPGKLSKPSKPQGITGAVDHGGNANDSILKNIAATNPFINILDGFDELWSMNQPDWRDGTALTEPGANGEVANYGDGPTVYFDGYKKDETKVVADKKTYANAEIRDAETWEAEYQICRRGYAKTELMKKLLAAYYDDQRDKIYSMMEGFWTFSKYIRRYR